LKYAVVDADGPAADAAKATGLPIGMAASDGRHIIGMSPRDCAIFKATSEPNKWYRFLAESASRGVNTSPPQLPIKPAINVAKDGGICCWDADEDAADDAAAAAATSARLIDEWVG
jgi:hypothetical protein